MWRQGNGVCVCGPPCAYKQLNSAVWDYPCLRQTTQTGKSRFPTRQRQKPNIKCCPQNFAEAPGLGWRKAPDDVKKMQKDRCAHTHTHTRWLLATRGMPLLLYARHIKDKNSHGALPVSRFPGCGVAAGHAYHVCYSRNVCWANQHLRPWLPCFPGTEHQPQPKSLQTLFSTYSPSTDGAPRRDTVRWGGECWAWLDVTC